MHFCHWWEDEHGGRYLIPGCNSRAVDPDSTACTCPSLARQLDAARRSIERLQRAAQGRREWHDAVVRAVYNHPDGVQIMKAAADAASSAPPSPHSRGPQGAGARRSDRTPTRNA